ncbi:MAG: hypothetical protein ACT4P6_14480 [Gemmatimonadaceae bacterium]
MKKPLYGTILGGVLGVLDGLTALASAPETRPQLVSIVIGSTFKGLLAGLLIGYFARKVHSLALGIVFGLIVGFALAALVVYMQVSAGEPGYYWQILLPGSLVGLIVGYATQRHMERAT